MIAARIAEMVGMLMIGDGVLAAVEPRKHVQLWRRGPDFWEEKMDFFIERPAMTRLLGAVEVGLGIWVAAQVAPSLRTTRLP